MKSTIAFKFDLNILLFNKHKSKLRYSIFITITPNAYREVTDTGYWQ